MPDLLIHAGQVFTAADHDSVLQDAWVRVEGDRIVEVTSSEPKARKSDVIRLEEKDATLLPGLIDCHVHLGLSGGPNWLAEAQQSYATACFRSAQHARSTLQAGFTTVRTLGGAPGADPALRDAQAIGLV